MAERERDREGLLMGIEEVLRVLGGEMHACPG